MRRKKGRALVVSVPQTAAEGRRAPIAAARVRPLPSVKGASELVVGLAVVMAEVAAAAAAERATPSPEATAKRRLAQRRARDLRLRLSNLIGRPEARAIAAAMTADGGLMLRAAGEAQAGMRERGVRAIVDAAAVAREHRLSSTSSFVLLGRSAQWSAVAGALLDRIVRSGVGTKRAERLLRMAGVAGTQARLDLIGALQLERGAERDGNAPGSGVDLAVAAELLARRDRDEGATTTEAP